MRPAPRPAAGRRDSEGQPSRGQRIPGGSPPGSRPENTGALMTLCLLAAGLLRSRLPPDLCIGPSPPLQGLRGARRAVCLGAGLLNLKKCVLFARLAHFFYLNGGQGQTTQPNEFKNKNQLSKYTRSCLTGSTVQTLACPYYNFHSIEKANSVHQHFIL